MANKIFSEQKEENIFLDLVLGFILSIIVILSATLGIVVAIFIGLLAIIPVIAVKKISIYFTKQVPYERYIGAAVAVIVVAFLAISIPNLALLTVIVGMSLYLVGVYYSPILSKILEKKWGI
jgi:hypothetical protein